MNDFLKGIKKIKNRKKINGLYESADILSPIEKQSLIIFSSVLFIPLLISVIIISINYI
ncbi:hypothetical protein [Senegalia massiliensis]|uniref:hypothetical protein n=1 Tax=Senegalia massiliensis TaxID=1720316 RepID=UPI001A9BC317|nr:hypothetical protein [Senegalia massiliensis]